MSNNTYYPNNVYEFLLFHGFHDRKDHIKCLPKSLQLIINDAATFISLAQSTKIDNLRYHGNKLFYNLQITEPINAEFVPSQEVYKVFFEGDNSDILPLIRDRKTCTIAFHYPTPA